MQICTAVILKWLAAFLSMLIVLSFSLNAKSQETEYQIGIAGYVFDRENIGEKIPKELLLNTDQVSALKEGGGHYIVQFAKPLTETLYREMQETFSLALSEFVPNQAYVEHLGPDVAQKLGQDSRIHALIPFHPAFKLSPNIGKLVPRTEERKQLEGLLLRAVLFENATPEENAKQMEVLGGSTIEVRNDRELGGPARIQFVLPDQSRLVQIAQLPGIRWIEEVGETIEDNATAAAVIQSGLLTRTPIWDRRLHGEGQIIGMIDGGPPDIDHCFFKDPALDPNLPGNLHRKILAIRNVALLRPRKHATFVAGNVAGDDFNAPGASPQRGGAWAAKLVASTLTDVSRGSLLLELTAAANAGATIHTNSWHANTGNPAIYTQTDADVDNFTWTNENQLVLGSMGNIGEEQGPPGTAKNAVGINAAQQVAAVIGDGNPGPTSDGRRKPDVVTVGCAIQSSLVNTDCDTGPARDGDVVCATSFATPHAAAAAALLRQYFTEGWYPSGRRQPVDAFVPSGALLKAALVNGTTDMDGVAGYPSVNEGWGLVRVDDVLFFFDSRDRRHLRAWDARHRNGLSNGQTVTRTVNVINSTEPLRVTLAWSDPPALAGSNRPIVNDLDLTVISPDGAQTYIGNWFVDGVSETGGTADAINPLEMVLVNNPARGEWKFNVTANAVNVGPTQGFGLVATGGFGGPSTFPDELPSCEEELPVDPHTPVGAVFPMCGHPSAVGDIPSIQFERFPTLRPLEKYCLAGRCPECKLGQCPEMELHFTDIGPFDVYLLDRASKKVISVAAGVDQKKQITFKPDVVDPIVGAIAPAMDVAIVPHDMKELDISHHAVEIRATGN